MILEFSLLKPSRENNMGQFFNQNGSRNGERLNWVGLKSDQLDVILIKTIWWKIQINEPINWLNGIKSGSPLSIDNPWTFMNLNFVAFLTSSLHNVCILDFISSKNIETILKQKRGKFRFARNSVRILN